MTTVKEVEELEKKIIAVQRVNPAGVDGTIIKLAYRSVRRAFWFPDEREKYFKQAQRLFRSAQREP